MDSEAIVWRAPAGRFCAGSPPPARSGGPGAALHAVPEARPRRPQLLPAGLGARRGRRGRCAYPGRRRGRCGPARGLRGAPLRSRRERRGTRKRRAHGTGSAERDRRSPLRGGVGRDVCVSPGPGPAPGRPPRLRGSQPPFSVRRYLPSSLSPSFPPSFLPLSISPLPPIYLSLNLCISTPSHSIFLYVFLSLYIFCFSLLLSMHF